ncbi:MAG: corrinoid protein [Dehalococcoidales bacterium]|nr:corrinoid protein [Dehalococcoidales bacterium]
MVNEALLAEAKQSIIDYDKDRAEEIARKALAAGMNPNDVLTEGFVPGITEVGDLFDRGQLFLPELMLAAEAMKAASAICVEALPATEVKVAKKVVIGTVEGDIHDIGKSIVVSFLLANGFEVYDMGRDVPIADFVQKAREVGADVVGSSALLTTTMQKQMVLEEELKKAGIRDKVKTIVGGAPCSEQWARRIGADAYAESAVDGLNKIKALTGLA